MKRNPQPVGKHNSSNRVHGNAVRVTHQMHIAAAMQDGLSGHRAETFVKQWDVGSRSVRMQLLEAFIGLHGASNVSTMNADMGDATPLFFTRLTAWFRLTYRRLKMEAMVPLDPAPTAAPETPEPVAPADGKDADGTMQTTADTTYGKANTTMLMGTKRSLVSTAPAPPPAPTVLVLLLQSMGIMVRGTHLMTQFVESGMAATLTDCLECGSLPVNSTIRHPYRALTVEEKSAILLLLLYVGNAGRVYREMVCDEEGLVSLLRVLQRETDTAVAGLLTELLMVLGKGNPRIAPLIHFGLMRLIVAYADADQQQQQEQEGGVDANGRSRAGGYSQPQVQAEEGTLEKTASAEVVLHAARVLRGLQMHKETHHRSNCAQRAAEEDKTAPVPSIDLVPVVCLGADVTALRHHYNSNPHIDSEEDLSNALGTSAAAAAADALLQPITQDNFFASLFYLVLHANPQFRVEGSELLALVAKNVLLLTPILNQCFDVLDDDLLAILDEEDADAISHRQRRQLSCGRVAVQIILCEDRTDYRLNAIVDLIAIRSAHMSMVKYLRMADQGDTAAVVDCCKALQLLARTSDSKQRAQLQKRANENGGARAHEAGVLKIGHVIRDSIGNSLYQVLIHQELTHEECFAMQRASRATATSSRR